MTCVGCYMCHNSSAVLRKQKLHEEVSHFWTVLRCLDCACHVAVMTCVGDAVCHTSSAVLRKQVRMHVLCALPLRCSARVHCYRGAPHTAVRCSSRSAR
jgi:hypothetical protein